MGCGSSTLSPSKKVQRNIPQEYPSFSSSSSVIKINFNEKYKLKREQFGKFTFRQNGGGYNTFLLSFILFTCVYFFLFLIYFLFSWSSSFRFKIK